ncbi:MULTISPECIES: hypothetical protein [Vibrio]|nr:MULTISPECIES: hypothetical protein [Vibrio]CDS95734.1 conserved hypothetical protein [Vibrio coralliirubri]CDT67789.1 conserved hypothetical protein [Vibrio coralliirubri]CDT85257.1 conserved hypothetical protein [Vibrio coralliirubri]
MSIEKMHGGATHTAEEFVLAGVAVSKGTENNRLVAPTMVNFAFASELFFKGILVEQGINPGRNHGLWGLYQLLPEDRKNWVRRMYIYLVGDISTDTFEKEIQRWSNSFIEIRYWHDETSKKQAYFDFSNFIPNLAISLYNAYVHYEELPVFEFPQLKGMHAK